MTHPRLRFPSSRCSIGVFGLGGPGNIFSDFFSNKSPLVIVVLAGAAFQNIFSPSVPLGGNRSRSEHRGKRSITGSVGGSFDLSPGAPGNIFYWPAATLLSLTYPRRRPINRRTHRHSYESLCLLENRDVQSAKLSRFLRNDRARDCRGRGEGVGRGEAGWRAGDERDAARPREGGRERKFNDPRETRRAAVVIDRRQYGCAKSPFCSLSAALRKLLHPHLRIHAKSNRPSVHSRPSVRTSVRLSSPIIGRALHRTAAFFRSFGTTADHRRPFRPFRAATHRPVPFSPPTARTPSPCRSIRGNNFSLRRCICPRDAFAWNDGTSLPELEIIHRYRRFPRGFFMERFSLLFQLTRFDRTQGKRLVLSREFVRS